MGSIKRKLRSMVRLVPVYQNYRAKKYFRDELVHLPAEKLVNQRVCHYMGNKAKQLSNMLGMIRIDIDPNTRFQVWIDETLFTFKSETMTDNVPPDYSLILDHSINELIEQCYKQRNNVEKNSYVLLKGISGYVSRIIETIDNVIEAHPKSKDRLSKTKSYYYGMQDRAANSLEEAFQRILFWSSIFWQSHHRLLGLGRLDKLLSKYEKEANDSLEIVRDFYDSLHKYYRFKSNKISLGDTGQIIVIGGMEPDGRYFCNSLTYIFIEAFIGHPLPDPKLLLRVSSEIPEDLLRLAIQCIATGIGCPLLSNDDVIVNAIEKFGYDYNDAYNYVTSACWEPLIYGKSLEKNNLSDINYAQAIVDMYMDESFDKKNDFDEVLKLYKSKLKSEINSQLDLINSVRWEEDPLMSLFISNCTQTGKDVSAGGAVYNDYGLLTVGMANAVDSLFNIKELCFDLKKLSLAEVQEAAKGNYPNDTIQTILYNKKYYGTDDKSVIGLVKELIDFTENQCQLYRNFLGGKVKFGLSTSNYAEVGSCTKATLDGRKDFEPLAVHISNPRGIAFTELIGFASGLNYEGIRSNGNVVDFFVNPSIIQGELEKFLLFVKKAIQLGFFQMQINVVSSEKLIDAKKHPGKYPDLIVRVWGFSAYFDELPEMYQDVLIKRALESEGRSA